MVRDQNTPKPLLSRIDEDMPQLSKSFIRVAEYLLKSPEDFMQKTVQEIANNANVSEPTLIRFCRHYGCTGVPDFRITLALSLSNNQHATNSNRLEPSFTDKSSVNEKLKESIAKSAFEFIEAGQSILIDSGSTMSLFAETLKNAPPLTIMTTGLNVMETLWGCKQHILMLPGGIVRFDASSLTGRSVEKTLKDMHFDMIFMGADSIVPEYGLTTFNEDEAHQNRIMINAADKVILLADSSKFSKPALHQICPIERIHAVITDYNIPAEAVESLISRDVNVIIAE